MKEKWSADEKIVQLLFVGISGVTNEGGKKALIVYDVKVVNVVSYVVIFGSYFIVPILFIYYHYFTLLWASFGKLRFYEFINTSESNIGMLHQLS